MRAMKSVIFDMDGVLINSSLVYAHAIQHAFSRRGYNLPVDVILSRIIPHVGGWVDAVFSENAARNGVLNEITEDVKETVAKSSGEVKYQDRLEETLTEIQKGRELFLITNSGSKLTEKVLERRNLKRFFKKIITSDDGFGAKEKAIAHLMDIYSLKKDEVVYVGDTEKDVKCAKEIGCKVIILYTPFSWDYGKYENIESANPDMIVKNLEELTEALRKV
jgi:HAD superfamily hydrolase (TIGR01549 family)